MRTILKLGLLLGVFAQATAQTTISYQGQLSNTGSPHNGQVEMEFALYDQESSGTPLETITPDPVDVEDGLFQVDLDFSDTFDGERWLEVTVEGTALAPRQKISASPIAVRALNAPETTVSASGFRSPPQDNFITTVDDSGNQGEDSSITIGADGLPVVSYYSASGPNDLKVAHCTAPDCSASTHTVVDASTSGTFSSIAIGTDDYPVISYYSFAEGGLNVAHCEDAACNSATTTTVDDGGGNIVGQHTSIAIGTDGLPIISHHDPNNGDLYVSHCNDIGCSSAVTTLVDDGGGNFVGSYTSIAIGIDGLPVISYLDGTANDLKVAHCTQPDCSSSTQVSIGTALGESTSVAIGRDGLPIISYLGSSTVLQVARCTTIDCSGTPDIFTIDGGGGDSVGHDSSITINRHGLPVISYRNYDQKDLRIAQCLKDDCSESVTRIIDDNGAVGEESSISIGADGRAIISYRDATNNNLKTARCGNEFCLPNFRRR